MTNHVANFGIENLRPSARQRSESRFAQRRQRLRHAPFAHPREMQDLNRRERLQMQFGIERLQRPQHLDVVVPLERRMQPANDVNLRDAQLERLLRLLDHLRQVVFVRARVAPPPIKRAKIAVEDADVGVIDVAIENVIRHVAVLALAHSVGHRANRGQILRAVQPQTIVLGDALCRLHLLVDVPQLRPLDQFVHRQTTSPPTAPKKHRANDRIHPKKRRVQADRILLSRQYMLRDKTNQDGRQSQVVWHAKM